MQTNPQRGWARLQGRGRNQLMVQRVKDKARRPVGRIKEQAPPAPAGPVDARVKALEQECERLKAELETARQRIAALEESRSAVASRIDWVIESLSGAVDRND